MAYCLEKMVISRRKATRIQTRQGHLQIEGPLRDIVPFWREISKHERVKSIIWLHNQMQKQSIELWLIPLEMS
jgi:hypothetical protein